MSCYTCKFYKKISNKFDGECRRYPPKLYVIPDYNGQGTVYQISNGIVYVTDDYWCGEHKDK